MLELEEGKRSRPVLRAGGGSKPASLTRREGLRPTGDITPRDSALPSVWSGITREFGQPPEERRPMTAVVTLTGALSHRITVRGLPVRMVQVVSQ